MPRKSGARAAALARLRAAQVTGVVYESPRRMDALLEAIEEAFGPNHPICVARELTKLHEEWARGAVAEVHAERGERAWRGECVVVIAAHTSANEPDDDSVRAEARRLLAAGASAREARDALVLTFGIAKKRAYDEVLSVRDSLK